MTPKVDDLTVLLLKRLLPGFDTSPTIRPTHCRKNARGSIARLDLPVAIGADYFFQLWFFEDGETQIAAELVQGDPGRDYFWYKPFELAEFSGSLEDLRRDFCDELEALLTHETHIVLRRGWVMWHIRCETRQEGKWKYFSSQATLRGIGLKPPRIEGKQKVFHSPALVRD